MQGSREAAYAGFWLRFVAGFFDGILIGMPVSFIVTKFYGQSWSYTNPSSHPFADLVFTGIATVIFWIFFTGQTPGKKIMGIRVVSFPDLKPISPIHAWIRFFIGYFVSTLVLGFGFLMIAFRTDKRGLHDIIAGTCVIQVAETKKTSEITTDHKTMEQDKLSTSTIILIILVFVLIYLYQRL